MNGYRIHYPVDPDLGALVNSLSDCKEKDFFFDTTPVEVYFSKKKDNSFLVMTYLWRKHRDRRVAKAALEMKYSPQERKIIAYAGLLKFQISMYEEKFYQKKYIDDSE
ncbi:MAG: hypothetical protein Q4A78_11915 [Peptostreptococcaceae bacterium]|nr:hypothetical protein [Peptostreptococcaceae bacterium]